MPVHSPLALGPRPDGDAPLSFDEVLAQENAVLAGDPAQRSALCISGGGVRSAIFGLGAVQGLADLGILQHFDYLSTVSGGGYIGSWLTAWKERDGGIERVVPQLRSGTPPPLGRPDPVRHLLEFSDSMSFSLSAKID